MTTFLVTGGAGFIGSHIVEALVAEGASVRVLDNLSTGHEENLAQVRDRIVFCRGDVRKALQGCDHVLHQAALASVPRSMDDPAATHAANATGTLHVLDEARRMGVERVVLASSSSVYGDTETLPKTETMPLAPISPYAASKCATEVYGHAWWRAFGLPVVTLRYFNVFGPRQDPNSPYAAVVPRFVSAMLAGRRPIIFGDGRQTRDFCYVDNVVRANLLALRAPQAPGRVLNVASGRRISLLDLVDHINRILGTSIAPRFEPPRPGDVRDSLADVSRARALLGYEAQVDVVEGLRRTVAWLRASHATA